ncbi:MAG: TGS domain-containing protein [Metallosphaera sp.]|uniref:TGS domain-containing protein n=1 Tax=Metallosphaera sp. TaxID=2020860 RepID=UPI00316AA5A5
MVTNLPAEAKTKWLRVMDAKTPEEKIKAIQDFLSSVPKHKGTENLVYWAKRRLSELREEAEKQRRKTKGGGFSFFIEKEGAGQVLVLGKEELKNPLVRNLTNVKQDPKDYPVPAMCYFEDSPIQLVNPPQIILDSRMIVSKLLGLARNSNSILMVLEDVDEFYRMKDFLENNNIVLGKPKGKVIIERFRSSKEGLRVVQLGRLVGTTEDEIKNYMREFGIKSAVIKIMGEVTLDDVEKSLFEAITFKPVVIASVKPFTVQGIPVVPINDVGRLKMELFNSLDVIRVYTKEPMEEPTTDPLFMKRGSTVYDVAQKLHSQLSENFKYARVWGRSARFPGQRVGEDHVLEDKDIVEIHVK